LNNIGAGATLAPILATQFISHGLLWSTYYFFTLGLQCLSVVGVGLSFRNEDAGLVRTGQRGKLSIAMHSKITWIASTFIFLYQGAEVALGGWLVTFMIQVLPSAG
jgi:fucose permease